MKKISDLPPESLSPWRGFVIINARPLNWYHPDLHNQLDGDGEQSVSRNSDEPTPPRRGCILLDRNAVEREKKKKKKKKKKRGKQADANDQDQKKRPAVIQTQNPSFDLDIEDEVDTTLRLSTLAPTSSDIPPSYERIKIPSLALNIVDDDDDDDDDLCCLRLGLPEPTIKKSEKKSRRKNSVPRDADENQNPLVPIEEIPSLFEKLVARGGRVPVFLFRKTMVESDVREDQNRLLVTKRERLMEFLSDEEKAEVDGGGKGLKIVGIDGGRNVFENVGVKRWAKVVVINSEWGKLVDANHGKAGDVVEVWGYRENGKPCMAFHFRRGRIEV